VTDNECDDREDEWNEVDEEKAECHEADDMILEGSRVISDFQSLFRQSLAT